MPAVTMAGENHYYSNSQTNHGQSQHNAQGYQQGYWYAQTTNAPATASHTQSANGTTTSYQALREDYGYSNANSAAYRNRSHYDTNTISALPSINSALNGEISRQPQAQVQIQAQVQAHSQSQSPPIAQEYGYSAQINQPEQQQQDTTYQQGSYNASSQPSYNQQQARPATATFSTTRSTYSAPRTTQTAQIQQYQQLRVTSPPATINSTQSQWAAANQRPQTESIGTRPLDHIARAAASATATQKTRQPTTQAATTEPPPNNLAPVTVDPHQIYDPYQEMLRQKKRREEEEAEKRRKAEIEGSRVAELRRRQAEEEAETDNATATPEVTLMTVEAPKKKPRQRKSEGAPSSGTSKPRKSRKSAPAAPAAVDEPDETAQAAALTLMQTANSLSGGGSLERQMKDMFRKMREFNAQDPSMLARLWQQERDEFLAKEPTDTTSNLESPVVTATPASVPPPVTKSAKATPVKAASKAAKAAKAKESAVTAPQAASAPAPAPALAPSTVTKPNMPTVPTEQVSQSQIPSAVSPTAKTAGTTWPADKKQQLAASACKLLLSIPANAGKSINAVQIKKILDTNPSYLELCQTIESMGFKVNRGDFARGLLSAVPDVNKSAQKPIPTLAAAPGAPSAIMQSSDAAAVQPALSVTSLIGGANAGLTNAATRLLSGGSVIEPETPNTANPKTKTPRSRKESKSIRKPSAETASASLEGVPGSRTYGLIDPQLEGLDAVKRFVDGQWQEIPAPLTISPSTAAKSKGSRLSKAQPPSSLPPAPPSKEETARKRDFADLVDLTAIDSDDEPTVHYFSDPKRHESNYPSAPVQLATPPTDPETMSNDIASTTIPPVPPLSLDHQEQIIETQQEPHTQQLPDQPTPKPREVPVPIPPRIPPDHPSRTIPMVEPIDKYRAIRRSTYNPKTIARDVLLACGRHPDMRHLNAHLEVLKTAFSSIDNSADLGTFRWDIADPGGPAPGSGAELLSCAVDNVDESDDADDEDESDREEQHRRLAVRAAVGVNGGRSEIQTSSPGVPLRKHFAKKMKLSDAQVRSHADRPPQTSGANSRPAAESTPSSSYRALWAAQSQAVDENGQPVKKKGRPVGWRKWMMKEPSAPKPSNKPVGRPPKVPAKEPEPEQYFPVFKCEWRDCNAELHNLATLRKHVNKLHGKKNSNSLYPCHWSDCGKVKAVNENGRTVSRFVAEEFAADDKWREHMEKRHIEPIAWELGDGPAGGLSERESEQSDAYLSDSRGRRVTPTVVVPESYKAGTASGSAASKPISAAEREARELQRLAEKRKRDMGPGIDKGGARLANDKRRHGFVDDDDIEMVVDVDD